ncbi:MAG: SDR family oxidoreductase, partial [Actinomycetota bacterium]|nr:SDR family oxidoreductase [Actinomycetota bacterium]
MRQPERSPEYPRTAELRYTAAPLADRVAVVTGSSSGIGRAVALELGRRGAAVVVTAREHSRAAATAAAIHGEGGRATAVAMDLTEPGVAEALVGGATAEYGRLDVLVNNAGAGQVAASETLAPEDFRRLIDLDLAAPFECAQAAARVMLAAGRGVIINVSSITGHTGLARRAAYSAAKHGLEGLTKTLAAEWSPRGVRVVSVAPGYVATELLAGTMAAGQFSLEDLEGRTPLRRVAKPEEVARVVAF